jgi:hypothetical protein
MLSEQQPDKQMANKLDSETESNRSTVYEIRVKSHLGPNWTDWFEGLTITCEDNGETLLTGPVIDQAALYGLLKKVRDLGLSLLSVNLVDHHQVNTADSNQ